MKKKLSEKLDHIRKQPEHTRMRIASYLTILTGVLLVGIWLTVLLPAQLYINREKTPKEKNNTPGNIQGIQDARPTPIATPRPTITPAITPTILPQKTLPVELPNALNE